MGGARDRTARSLPDGKTVMTQRMNSDGASSLEEPEVGIPGLRPWTFITWYPYCRRSDALAEQLGARSHLIHYLKFKVPYLAPIKYLLQSIRTVWILCVERPSLVVVVTSHWCWAS